MRSPVACSSVSNATSRQVPSNATERSLMSLASHRRRLDRQAAAAPGEIGLEVEQHLRAVLRHLRMHAVHARAQAPLQRAELLPFEAICRIAVWLALGQRLA